MSAMDIDEQTKKKLIISKTEIETVLQGRINSIYE